MLKIIFKKTWFNLNHTIPAIKKIFGFPYKIQKTGLAPNSQSDYVLIVLLKISKVKYNQQKKHHVAILYDSS